VIRRVVLVSGVLLVISMALAAQTDPVEAEVTLWTAEIRRHVPGTDDEAARGLAQWPWRRVQAVLGRLFDRRVLDTTLLLRATAAYGDIALMIPREQRPVYPTLGTGGPVTLANDGRPVGQTRRDTHLALAHATVRRVVRSRDATEDDKAFAAIWYAAVAAVLSRAHDLAGLKDHLEEARAQLPARAEIEFLSGCLAESIASPAVQAALSATERDERRPSQLKAGDLLRRSDLTRSTNLNLARSHYRRALQIDADHEEAQIRLARILLADGRTKDALALLEPALVNQDPALRYFHLLLLGRAYERTNQPGDARRSFESASRLFPDAQSPWLALSALAAAAGDVEGSRRALDRVVTRTEAADDPWWTYDECSGRNASRIYTDFNQAVQRLGGGSSAGGTP
jgi:hypothetical protein